MKKFRVGTTKGQLVLLWIVIMLLIVFSISMIGLIFEDLEIGLFMIFGCVIPIITVCIWAIIYTQNNYNRTAYALAGRKKKAKIVKVRKIGGRAPYTEITYSYRTDMGEEVLGIQGVPYCWYRICEENMIINVYVNGEYGCFKKEEFKYDVTHQFNNEFEY